jgi:hypothetical protein
MWGSYQEVGGRTEDTGGTMRGMWKEPSYVLSLHAVDSCMCC